MLPKGFICGQPHGELSGTISTAKPMEVIETGTQILLLTSSPLRYLELAVTTELGGHVEGVSSRRQEFLTHSQFWVLIPSWESQPHPRPADSTKAPQRAKGSRGERGTPLLMGGEAGWRRGQEGGFLFL